MVASVPLVLTFVIVPAAIGYECQNRDTRIPVPCCTAIAGDNLPANCRMQDSPATAFSLCKAPTPNCAAGTRREGMASDVPAISNCHSSHGLTGNADIGSC